MFHPTNKLGIYTSGYGIRNGVFHAGIDIGVPVGTPIYAVDDGIIIKIDDKCFDGNLSCGLGFGNHISIDHQNDIYTNYAHLSRVVVNVGDKVKRGQIIGYSGNTGYSTGAHLHFEIRKGGWLSNVHFDPKPYLDGQKRLPKSFSLYVAKRTPKFFFMGLAFGVMVFSIIKLKND